MILSVLYTPPPFLLDSDQTARSPSESQWSPSGVLAVPVIQVESHQNPLRLRHKVSKQVCKFVMICIEVNNMFVMFCIEVNNMFVIVYTKVSKVCNKVGKQVCNVLY